MIERQQVRKHVGNLNSATVHVSEQDTIIHTNVRGYKH